MLKIRIGERTYEWDSAAPVTAGDLAAARELGLGIDGLQNLFARLSAALGRDPAQGRIIEIAELVVQVAFIAAARQDHQLRYRDFAYSVSLEDLSNLWIGGTESSPGGADDGTAGTAASTGGLGTALREAGVATEPSTEPAADLSVEKPKSKRPSRARRTT